MREWLDVDPRLFPRPIQPTAAPPPLQIIPEKSSAARISLKERMEKRSLYEYLDKGGELISYCQAGLTQSNDDPSDSSRLKQIADKFGKFCLDSDSWGFEDIYRVAQQLHFLALEMFQDLHIRDARDTRQITRGLDLLQNLLRDCERDYDRRVAVAVYLHTFAPDASR